MGTRNLTAVYIDGTYKVAQYGQWDGYPEGQGMKCLNFARTIANPESREKFAAKVRACAWATKKYIDGINRRIDSGEFEKWQDVYPELSRDTGGEILNLIMSKPVGLKLQNDIAFAADSLMCEWAWVIDLDAGTFEGFRGFNNNRELTPDDRFYFLRDKENRKRYGQDNKPYHGVTLAVKWPLDALPTDEAFLAAFKEGDGE